MAQRTKDTARGERIKERRTGLPALTQPALARVLGVHTNTVANWEDGFTVPASKLPLLADALGTTTDYLLGRTDVPDAPPAAHPQSDHATEAARDGFSRVAGLVSELREEMELRLEAQAEATRTLLLELRRLQRLVRALSEPDTAGASKRAPRGSQGPLAQ